MKQMMQQWIDDVLLVEYKDADFVLKQKAKILSFFVFLVIGVCLMVYTYTFFDGSGLVVAIPTTFVVFFSIIVLLLIKKGYYNFSGHLLLTVAMLATWITMFLDDQNLIYKIDTIVYVIGIFGLTSLVFDKKKQLILVYLVLNIIALILFCYHLAGGYGFTMIQLMEYFMDNFLMLLMVAIISYQVVSINQVSLNKANESTLAAEKEAKKNQELSRTLEMKVGQRTRELVNKNKELENEIKERVKAEEALKSAQDELVEHAHRSGMAEIAADTLHNVGNVLNSVKTSSHVIKEIIKKFPNEEFSKACHLIKDNSDNISEFLQKDDKGSKIIEYLLALEQAFDTSLKEVSENFERLDERIETISQVILAQQNYAGRHFLTESIDLEVMIDNALTLIPNTFGEKGIKLVKKIDAVPAIKGQKNKLLHTLVNLLKNAVQAMSGIEGVEKKVVTNLYREKNQVVLSITDKGIGIAAEDLDRIFSHGYTTRKDGFGFGLHSCANYMQEMGAAIVAESEGINKGATFSLIFPLE
ncbi:MAG: ATP-binding protein [Proteobacteria bacterium]|nr:ATP-binding protein [Pseudomonadota bacterium]